MILTADSGSTKTTWVLADTTGILQTFDTRGLNPYHITEETILGTLCNDVLPAIADAGNISEIYFYGAGCTPSKTDGLKRLLQTVFDAAYIEVSSDLLGACRALCGEQAGIVCILGTGSNTCEYDGREIVANTPPLGYILGDEGSGASLGKHFVADCLKGLLPPHIVRSFTEEIGLTSNMILERVYRQPEANRFLAGLTRFMSAHRNEPAIHRIVKESFAEMLERNVTRYNTSQKTINFAGSIAYVFGDILSEAVLDKGFAMGKILKSPALAIADFHMNRHGR